MLVRMLGAKALHLAYVLPFPDCCRAVRIIALADELQAHIDSLCSVKSVTTENNRVQLQAHIDSLGSVNARAALWPPGPIGKHLAEHSYNGGPSPWVAIILIQPDLQQSTPTPGRR